MKRKLWLLAVLVLCFVLAVGILAACNGSGGSGQQTPGGENPGTETPGDNPGGEDPGDETVSFIVTFDTQGGSVLADITVENGQVIGEFTLPTKQCSRLVGFALDIAGEQMWNVLTDTVSANITLYAIWEDAHTWGEWADTTPATCTENGERTRECEVCDKTEREAIDALGHDAGGVAWEHDPESHWKICKRCNKEAEKNAHDFGTTGICFCGVIGETPVSEFIFSSLGNNEWEVTEYIGTRLAVVIPSVYQNGAVTSIGSSAFDGYTGLTSITIPNSVTSIGDRVFYGCSGLTSVTIGNGVTSIGDYAFYGTAWYDSQPDGLVYAGKVAYKYKGTMPSNTSVVLEEGTLGIADDAFRSCSGLTSITIPDSVTSIGSYAFSGCSRLTSVYYTGDVAGWCGISGLDEVMLSWRTLYIDGRKVEGAIVIPDGVQSVLSYAFCYQTGITSITIPDSVTSIGDRVFYDCSGLTSVTIGDSVTSIGYQAFRNCSGLTSITIPDSVTNIGARAFSGCSGLTSVTIGNSVTSIGYDAFEDCSGLTEINWNAVSVGDFYYGSNVFYNAGTAGDGITVTFGDDVQRILAYLFYVGSSSYRPNIKSVTIGNGVTSIGSYAFYGCSGLTSITIPDSVTDIGWYAFEDCSGLTSVTIGNGVTSIGGFAFYYCSGLTSITIPDSVTSIGRHAFSNCSGLTSVTIGNGVTSIGEFAFSGCSRLTSIIIPDSVTSIGDCVFSGCSGLTSITIPDSVTSIGSDAFDECYKLIEVYNRSNLNITAGSTAYGYAGYYAKNVYNEEGVSQFTDTSDGFRFFYDGTNAYLMGYYGDETELTLPTGFTAYDGTKVTKYAIYDYAFHWKMDIKSVIISDNVIGIGDNAFYRCSGLTSVTIPDSVTSIGGAAFAYCTGLTSVTIGNGVTSIGDSAFYNCVGLTSVTFEGTVDEWNVIDKGMNWNFNCRFTKVVCSDGTVSV